MQSAGHDPHPGGPNRPAGVRHGPLKLAAAETADGMRLLHFYVDPETDATERLAALTDTWAEGDHEIVAAEDPAWERVGHLRA